MNTRALVTVGASALVLAVLVGGNPRHGGVAFASARDASQGEKQAMADAVKAQDMLGKGNADAAVVSAEAAVSTRPQVADYRVLLGQSYLKAGRFTSARDAFADALSLEPDNAKAALNFALAQIATGDWDGARKTLDTHKSTLAASDRGLAMALAGDPNGAIAVLVPVVRSSEGDAKARQNLALALALAGRWQESRSIVSYDVAPNEVDQRMEQWAAFARPHAAYDQVASLLGVTPVEDHGQPVALALNAAAPVAVAAAVTPAVADTVVTAAIPVATPAVAGAPMVQFAPRHEVVQALPTWVAAPIKAAAAAMSAKAVATVAVRDAAPSAAAASRFAPKPLASGTFYVQLGAYENAGVAKDGWNRIKRRFAGVGAHTPSGMDFTGNGGKFYRLSVGGFTHADAASLCGRYRSHGGKCFVRAGAGDQAVAWVAQGQKLASR
ncbi:MAG: tetratricopeptide repeat protein [Pseudomonadota bacterium]|nr:tetratricopeptide repeat protein [Pseudomonadota bacterium]